MSAEPLATASNLSRVVTGTHAIPSGELFERFHDEFAKVDRVARGFPLLGQE